MSGARSWSLIAAGAAVQHNASRNSGPVANPSGVYPGSGLGRQYAHCDSVMKWYVEDIAGMFTSGLEI